MRGPGGRIPTGDDEVRLRARSEDRPGEHSPDAAAVLSAVWGSSLDGILNVDEGGLVRAVNPAAERLFAGAAPILVGQPLEALVELAGGGEDADGWWRAPAGGADAAPLEGRGRRCDGEPFDVEVSVGRVEGGERSVVVVRDLTERNRLEGEVLRLRRLETVGALAAGVAHDMNNVLMGILGSADRALSSLDQPADHRGRDTRERLEELRRVARGGASVMGRLNAYTRGGQLRRSDTAELDAAVRDTAAMLRPLLGEDVALAVVLGAPGARVRGASSRLEQILVNLAVNARNAMPRGGRLEIQTGQWRAEDRRLVRLEVRDEGRGMSEEVRARIFDPFFSTRADGMGLGLSTVRQIIEGAGGWIEIHSEHGEGTSVVVDLPEVVASAAPPRISMKKPAAPPASVLLVDDDSLVRGTERGYLEDGGHRVLEAVNAGHAVEVCRGHEGALDVVVTNVVLPGTTPGPQLVEDLVRLRPDLRVLFMSAYPHDVLIRRGLVDESTFVLQKPYSSAELSDALAGVLAPPSPPARESSTPEEPRPPKAEVLVVAEAAALRETLGELLRAQGHDVVTAPSAEEARREASRRPGLDVVVTDGALPDGDGARLVDELRVTHGEIGAIVLFDPEAADAPTSTAGRAGPRTLWVSNPPSMHDLIEGIEAIHRRPSG